MSLELANHHARRDTNFENAAQRFEQNFKLLLCGTKVSTLWNTNIVMQLRNLQSSWHLSAKTTKIHAPIYFPLCQCKSLENAHLWSFMLTGKSLGKHIKCELLLCFWTLKKIEFSTSKLRFRYFLSELKIEILIFQNWDFDISKLRFRYWRRYRKNWDSEISSAKYQFWGQNWYFERYQ